MIFFLCLCLSFFICVFLATRPVKKAQEKTPEKTPDKAPEKAVPGPSCTHTHTLQINTDDLPLCRFAAALGQASFDAWVEVANLSEEQKAGYRSLPPQCRALLRRGALRTTSPSP